MANHIKEVAAMLGLEIGELFKVRVDDDIEPYVFMFVIGGLTSDAFNVSPSYECMVLEGLLAGHYEVVKIE